MSSYRAAEKGDGGEAPGPDAHRKHGLLTVTQSVLSLLPPQRLNNSQPDLIATCYHLPKVKLLIKLGKRPLAKEKRL